MRLSKIFWGGVALAALSLGFISCSESEDDDGAIDGESISYTNSDTSNIYRSFKSTKTKHYSANALITINNAASTTTSYPAVAGYGFLFGLEETTTTVNASANTTYYEDSANKTKASFYTFGIAAVRWNATNSTAEWYVSWCENVPSTCFNSTTSNDFSGTVYAANSSTTTTLGTETTVVKGDNNTAWKAVSGFSLTDSKSFIAQIRVVANGDGSYSVGLYKNAETSSALGTGTITAATTKFTAKTQKDIGRYITVYPGQTTTGRIDYSDISGNPIPADYNED